MLRRLRRAWRAHHLIERWENWRYHNSALFAVSMVVLVLLIDTHAAFELIEHFKTLSYVGAFIAGLLSPSTFTTIPAIVLLYGLANTLNPYATALIAGCGAMMSDYLIFRFFKDRVFEELQPIFGQFKSNRLVTLFHTPYFAWLMPIFGMLIIASPLPDEVGLGLISTRPIKTWQFMMLAFVLNTLGILAIVLGARLF